MIREAGFRRRGGSYHKAARGRGVHKEEEDGSFWEGGERPCVRCEDGRAEAAPGAPMGEVSSLLVVLLALRVCSCSRFSRAS